MGNFLREWSAWFSVKTPVGNGRFARPALRPGKSRTKNHHQNRPREDFKKMEMAHLGKHGRIGHGRVINI